ncbi:MAG: hypothetical protein ACRD36_02330 [Candidatus Acidiferrum sp.]
MNKLPRRFLRPTAIPSGSILALLAMVLSFAAPGCQSNSHTSNPRLHKIDEILAGQLPKGTTRTRVSFFLNSRGFIEESSSDPATVVGIVRLVDTDTLQPATARVTFHFDPQDRLTTYDMQSAPDSEGP